MQVENKNPSRIYNISAAAASAAAGLLLRAACPGMNIAPAAPLAFALFFAALSLTERRLLPGLLFGMGLALSLTPWVLTALTGHFSIAYPAALIAYLAGVGLIPGFYFMIWGFFINKILPEKNSGVKKVYIFALSAGASFTVIEYIRTLLSPEGGWGHLASIYYRIPELLQVTRITGSAFLTFLTVLTGAIFLFAFRNLQRKKLQSALVLLLPPILIWAMVYTGGSLTINKSKKGEEVILQGALIHPAISQSQRWRRSSHGPNLMRYCRMSLAAFPDPIGKNETRIIFWPETAVTAGLLDNREAKETAEAVIKQTGAWLLAGSPHRGKGSSLTNAALLLNPDGKVAGNYAKVHLLPWAETPLITGMETNRDHAPYRAGTSPVLLPVTTGSRVINCAPLICFEVGIAPFAARYRRMGAHLLVNLSNDAWFGNSSESEQQLALLVLRAAETGLPAVRVTGYGISAVINRFGKIETVSSIDRPETITASLSAGAPLSSFYSRFPGWFILLCMTLLIPPILLFRKKI